MFYEPPDSEKDRILQELKDSVWVNISKFLGLHEDAALENKRTIGYFLWAIDPGFADKLLEGVGDWRDDFQQLLNQCVTLFAQCLSRVTEDAFTGGSVDRNGLIGMSVGLESTHEALVEYQLERRRMLQAARGEQELPPFLRVPDPLSTLLEDYILVIVENRGLPEGPFVVDLLRRCKSDEEAERLDGLLAEINRFAKELLSEGSISEEELLDKLAGRAYFLLGSE